MTDTDRGSPIEREAAGPDGEVVLLHLNNGPLNTLDLEMCQELTAALRAAGDQGAPVVIAGRGRAFCAGVDLRSLLEGGTALVRRFVPALDELFWAALTLPVPLVAAVDGHAIAGGAVLAAAADHVVMAEGKGLMGVPELRVGVAFPRGALAVLRYRLGDAPTRRLVLEAANHTPHEARARGLVDEVVDPHRVLGRAVEAAADLAAMTPADAFAMTTSQLLGATRGSRDADAEDDAAFVELWCRRIEDGWTARYL